MMNAVRPTQSSPQYILELSVTLPPNQQQIDFAVTVIRDASGEILSRAHEYLRGDGFTFTFPVKQLPDGHYALPKGGSCEFRGYMLNHQMNMLIRACTFRWNIKLN